MGYNLAKRTMKKYLMVFLFILASVFTYAIPDGCYDGRYKCGVYISGDVIHVTNKNGEVIARWTIVREDNEGNLTVKSEYGATQSAKWWREDGQVYLYFNYQNWTRQ